MAWEPVRHQWMWGPSRTVHRPAPPGFLLLLLESTELRGRQKRNHHKREHPLYSSSTVPGAPRSIHCLTTLGHLAPCWLLGCTAGVTDWWQMKSTEESLRVIKLSQETLRTWDRLAGPPQSSISVYCLPASRREADSVWAISSKLCGGRLAVQRLFGPERRHASEPSLWLGVCVFPKVCDFFFFLNHKGCMRMGGSSKCGQDPKTEL